MELSMVANYYAEIDILCIVLLILLAAKTRASSFIGSQKQSFEAVLLCHIVFTASDLVWVFNNGFLSLTEIFPRGGVAVSCVLNGMNVLLAGATGFAWLIFSEIMQGNYLARNRKKFALALCPLLFLAALTVTTGRTHLMFYVSPQGEFFRGEGYAIQWLLSYSYLVMASLLSVRHMKQAKTMQGKQLSRTVALFICLPLCTGVVQILLPNMQVLFLGTVLALLSIYISLQEMQVLTDPLTGLNNRMQLDQKIADAVQRWSGEQELYLLSIDVDDFKSVNDQYGHLEGDRALMLIADALRENCGGTDYICRYGGDEFAVLRHTADGAGCEQFMQAVNDTLAGCGTPYALAVSVGISRYSPDMSAGELIHAADQAMYRAKQSKRPVY